MQGNTTTTMIFNILVDAVVSATLKVVFGPQEARNSMRWAAKECNHIWVKDALIVKVAMFRRVRIETNI